MLNEIINYINENIKTNVFQKDGLHNSLLLGVAESVARSNTTNDTVPIIFNDKELLVELTDKYNVILFHKINRSQIQITKDNYGSENNSLLKSYNVSLIVFFDRKKINLCKEDFELLVSAYLPSNITQQLIKNLNIQNCYIEPLQTDYNGYALLQREYKTSQFNLKPTHTMFEVQYKIDLKFNKNCLNKCSCI